MRSVATDRFNGYMCATRRWRRSRRVPTRTPRGELAVCAGSCGPGNLHLIYGLYDCHRSAVPVLAIAAQIPTSEIGSGYFQETHPEFLFKDCSYSCQLVSIPAQMPRALETAMTHAIGQRGVTVIVIPGDVAPQGAGGFRHGHVSETHAAVGLPIGSRSRPARENSERGEAGNALLRRGLRHALPRF